MFFVAHQRPAGSLRQHRILHTCRRNDGGRACKASFRATHLETKSPWNQSPVIADCGYGTSVRSGLFQSA